MNWLLKASSWNSHLTLPCDLLLIMESLHMSTNICWKYAYLYMIYVSIYMFSHSIMLGFLRPHGLQHARLPCLSPTPRDCSDSCPSSRWCHPTILSSVVSFSSFNLSQHQGLFQQSDLCIQVTKVLAFHLQHEFIPMNIQDWSPLGWTGWISLQSKGLSRVFSNTTVQKHQFFSTQLSSWSSSHIHTWLLEKP